MKTFRIASYILGVSSCLALAALNDSVAHADILPAQAPPVVTHVGSTYFYRYEIFVTDQQNLKPGNFFTFYDFAGYVPGSATFNSTLWSIAPSLTTPSPVYSAATLQDDPTIMNVTFTYKAGKPTVLGPQSLGFFTLGSTLPVSTNYQRFVGRGTTKVPGFANDNITYYLAPGPGPVPEPSAYAFAGFAGLGMVGLILRARRRGANTTAATV